MNISDIGKVLSSNTRCRLLVLLEKSLSLNEIYNKYREEDQKTLRKETIYRHLESLVDSGLVEKKYYQDDKRVKYYCSLKELRFELATGNLSVIKGDEKID
ncbi:MAG: helix-turn-helix domain-containing protein [Candidatus Thorarchaeota archaeon]